MTKPSSIHIIGNRVIDPQTILAKAQEYTDTMDGLILFWYVKGSDRTQVNALTSNLNTHEVNYGLDQLKALIHSGQLTQE